MDSLVSRCCAVSALCLELHHQHLWHPQSLQLHDQAQESTGLCLGTGMGKV